MEPVDDPAPGRTAVLVIDMINDMAFEGGEAMMADALAAARRIAALISAARSRGVPVVYVNDNYGQWHSERAKIIAHCERPEAAGRELVGIVRPEPGDYFVIKPQHSGFYASNLAVLLPKLGASRLILTGVATDICVLFTAGDAHMRAYDLWTPRDCVAARAKPRSEWALEIMSEALGADTQAFDEARLDAWLDDADAQSN